MDSDFFRVLMLGQQVQIQSRTCADKETEFQSDVFGETIRLDPNDTLSPIRLDPVPGVCHHM